MGTRSVGVVSRLVWIVAWLVRVVARLIGVVTRLVGVVTRLVWIVAWLVGVVARLIGAVTRLVGVVARLVGVVAWLAGVVAWLGLLGRLGFGWCWGRCRGRCRLVGLIVEGKAQIIHSSTPSWPLGAPRTCSRATDQCFVLKSASRTGTVAAPTHSTIQRITGVIYLALGRIQVTFCSFDP